MEQPIYEDMPYELGTFNNGKKNGFWQCFYKFNFLMEEGYYDEFGQRCGTWKEYYLNGSLSAEGIYLNGFKHNSWNYFYENGILLAVGKYYIGEGVEIFYHESGNLKTTGKCENNFRQGNWIWYYENGFLEMYGSYIDNQENGWWKEFYSNGLRYRVTNYKNGKILYDSWYDTDGILEGEMNFEDTGL